jgi:dienelactone hydrolase
VGATIEWRAREPVDRAEEREFHVKRPSGPVPVLAWLPAQAASSPPPLVLLGHGGSSDKRSERIVRLGRWFASEAGFAALAIDGPFHGERVTTAMTDEAYWAEIAREGAEAVLDRMAGDWWAAVDALATEGLADDRRLGYVGLSMGSRFGLPLVATLGDRFRAAVLGKFGLRQGPALNPAMNLPERFAADAARITCPVLFHVQLDDDLFPLDGQRRLFDRLATARKEWLAYPGPHGVTDPGAEARWRNFIRDALSEK